jgi:hypothetical protein
MEQALSPEVNVSQLEEEFDNDNTVLSPIEVRWRDRQVFLQSRGYILRPRYRPGWIPSWTVDPSLTPRMCEDYIETPVSNLRPCLTRF